MKNQKQTLFRIIPDLIAFLLGLAAAWFLKWETRDLVWSLWFCSLALGYLTLLITLGGGAYIGYHMVRHESFDQKYRRPAMGTGIAIGVFFLAFFSFHFCGFHAGHSAFLSFLFPLEGVSEFGFGEAFTNPPLLLGLAFTHLMKPYGIFLLPAIIAERKHLQAPLVKAIQSVRAGTLKPDPSLLRKAIGKEGENRSPVSDFMFRPYRNVIRMHLLIFFFAGAHALKLDSFAIYAVVYTVYFFPWREFRKTKPGNAEA